MIEIILGSALFISDALLLWFFMHYKETLEQMRYQEYYMGLLDYNGYSLELSTRTEEPTLEEEALLYTMEQKLKDQAVVLGINIDFPEKPAGHQSLD